MITAIFGKVIKCEVCERKRRIKNGTNQFWLDDLSVCEGCFNQARLKAV